MIGDNHQWFLARTARANKTVYWPEQKPIPPFARNGGVVPPRFAVVHSRLDLGTVPCLDRRGGIGPGNDFQLVGWRRRRQTAPLPDTRGDSSRKTRFGWFAGKARVREGLETTR